jgi:aerobic C4-dicarboxylate transport protein
MLAEPANTTAEAPPPRKKPFYAGLSFQVLAGVAVAVILGYVNPAMAVSMKPLGDVFIRMITMIITLVIFCTLVTGIAGMEDMKKVGRVGGKALLYFELVSTMALLIGLLVGNLAHPGSGFNVDPTTLDARTSPTFSSTLFPTPSSTHSAAETFCRCCWSRCSSALRYPLPGRDANPFSM